MKRNLFIVHDEAHGFWTGEPWLVVNSAFEDRPPIASFRTDNEAGAFIDEQAEIEAQEREAMLQHEREHRCGMV